MNDTNLCNCSRPAGDAFACTYCRDTAKENLLHIADLTSALDEKRAKITTTWNVSNMTMNKPPVRWRTDDGQKLTSLATHGTFIPSSALAFDPRVTHVAERVHNALVGSFRILIGEDRANITNPGSALLARYLAEHVDEIRHRPEASDEFGTYDRIKSDLFALFDNPPPTLYLGRCNTHTEFGPCPEILYVENSIPLRTEVTCPHCHEQHTVDNRRQELLTGVDDYLGTAKEISRLLRILGGQDVTKQAISTYVQTGKLASTGTRVEYTREGLRTESATYRIGAVREIVATLESDRRRSRATRRLAKHGLDISGLGA